MEIIHLPAIIFGGIGFGVLLLYITVARPESIDSDIRQWEKAKKVLHPKDKKADPDIPCFRKRFL